MSKTKLQALRRQLIKDLAAAQTAYDTCTDCPRIRRRKGAAVDELRHRLYCVENQLAESGGEKHD